ncbi:MAG TPA: DUF502 domain-containing protein [Thermoanaerobaculia bacterium]
MSWRHRLRNVLLAGLLFLTPVYVTIYILVLLFRFMDGIFAPLIDRAFATFLGERDVHIPGLGILLTLTVILFLGWLSRRVVGRRLLSVFESFIRRIPIARSVYGGTKGVLEAVSRDQADAFKKVVIVEFPRPGIYAIGFVTGAGAYWGSTDPRLDQELVPVFIPKTPNPTGGFLLLVPPHEIMDCAMTVEEGIRMVVSGGILQPEGLVERLKPTEAAPEMVAVRE